VRGTFLTILLGKPCWERLVGITIIVVLYLAGWHRKLAERASRRGTGQRERFAFGPSLANINSRLGPFSE